MQIKLGTLRKIIRETVESMESAKARWNENVPTLDEIQAKSTTYKKAYSDLVEFIKSWGGGQYQETGPEDPFPGALKPVSFKKEPFVSSAWNSLEPFEKYCLMVGDPAKSPECGAILDAAGARYGAKTTSGKKFLTSSDHAQLMDHLMGGSEYDAGSEHQVGERAYGSAATHASIAREKEQQKARWLAARDRKNAAARAKRAASKSGV